MSANLSIKIIIKIIKSKLNVDFGHWFPDYFIDICKSDLIKFDSFLVFLLYTLLKKSYLGIQTQNNRSVTIIGGGSYEVSLSISCFMFLSLLYLLSKVPFSHPIWALRSHSFKGFHTITWLLFAPNFEHPHPEDHIYITAIVK